MSPLPHPSDAPPLIEPDGIEPRPSTAPAAKHARTALLFELPRIAIDPAVLSFDSLHVLNDLTRTQHETPIVPQHAPTRPPGGAPSRPPRHRSPSQPSNPVHRAREARRPPASFSSHGIATSLGPPPALITRRSCQSDLARKAQNPAQLAQSQNNKVLTTRNNRESTAALRPASADRQPNGAKSPLLSQAPDNKMEEDQAADNNSSGGDEDYFDADPQPQMAGGQLGVDGDTSGQSSDDVFLKLAQDGPESARNNNAASHLERKPSRGRGHPYTQSPALDSESSRPRRNSNGRNSGYSTRVAPPARDAAFTENRRTSASDAGMHSAIPPRNPAMTSSSEQRFNAYRSKYNMPSSTLHSTSLVSRPESMPQSSRRPSASDAFHNRPQAYRPSKLHYSSNGDNDLSSQADTSSELRRTSLRAESHADGAESVVSNTAQSAMWDELNELKTRLQKIELGEKQPTFSSGGTLSNGSNERPRTATTTVTTMSSSPKIAKSGISPTDGTIGGPAAANIHPLLHQSLARCKAGLPPSIYRPLETAVSDALEMAILAGAAGPQSAMLSSASIINGAVTDRHLRRKADNVCRSLTDLCISLCQGKLNTNVAGTQTSFARPASRGVSSSMDSPISGVPTTTYTRHASLEPEPNVLSRPTPSRALDRVEARRASLMSISANSSPRDSVSSPAQVDSASTADATPSPREAPKPARTGTSLMRLRRRAVVEDEEDDDPTQRPVSRATTDIGTSFRKRPNRFSGGYLNSSREYTSQHPLPSIPSNPSLPKPTPLRRITATTFNKTPEDSNSNSAPSSLQRDGTRKFLNRDGEPMYLNADVSTDDERKNRRRSLNLYSAARTSLGLSRQSSLSKNRSVTAGGMGGE